MLLLPRQLDRSATAALQCSVHVGDRPHTPRHILQARAIPSCTSMPQDAVEPSRNGRCWLVGAGPGATEHLTLKAVRVIAQAEVIIYDDLGTQAALDEFGPPGADKIYVGKRGARTSTKQSSIDSLLVEHCRLGKRVVRLKGGCPSVFSRCSSELDALARAGITAELVPGISSALAAPLFAGFPLTDKDVGRSFVVASAHDPLSFDWASVRGIDSLVLLMGGGNLAGIVQALHKDWKPDTPVVVVRSASLPEQKIWRSTLDSILDVTSDAGNLSPCITIVGQVASRRHSSGVGCA